MYATLYKNSNKYYLLKENILSRKRYLKSHYVNIGFMTPKLLLTRTIAFAYTVILSYRR